MVGAGWLSVELKDAPSCDLGLVAEKSSNIFHFNGQLVAYLTGNMVSWYLTDIIDEYSMMSHCQGNAKIGV